MVIKTRIDGEFTGTDDEVVFELQNGQIWQQVGYRYRYMYKYSPKVTIEKHGSTGTMIIDGFREPIKVRRIS